MRIAEKTLISRINRKLASEGERLRVSRSTQARVDLGDFYVTDENNCVTAKYVDLEQWGRDLGVLQANEKLAD